MTGEKELCRACGSAECERVAVDIGVGTQYGPLECFRCGWSEDGPDVWPFDYWADDWCEEFKP